MKEWLYIMVLWLAFAGCGSSDDPDDPQPEDNKGLVLKVDKPQVNNSGTEQVKFTVFMNGKDVTASSSIVDQASRKECADAMFAPTPNTKPGIYTFKATFQKNTSAAVTVEVVSAGFLKNVLLQEFTSTTCIYCLGMAEILETDILPKVPGRICLMAFHGNVSGPDPMATLEYVSSMQHHFSFTSYPTLVVEHDFIWNRIAGKTDEITDLTNQSAMVGIALNTTLEGRRLKAKVSVKALADCGTSCRVAVVLIEDNFKALQSYPTGGPQVVNYKHIVREYLTDLFGDKENTGSGKITVDEEWTRTFDYAIPSDWKPADMELIAYVLGDDGKVLNCRMVKLGENAEYQK